MRARDIVGRTVVAVEQNRFWDESTGEFAWSVETLILDNGSRVNLIALEGGFQPYVHVTVTP